jgi:hypothetical protein
MFARLRGTRPVLSDEFPEEAGADDMIILLVYKLAGCMGSGTSSVFVWVSRL